MKYDNRTTRQYFVGRIDERRKAGDVRPLVQLAEEITADITGPEARRILVQQLCNDYRRHGRDIALADDEQVFPLLYDFGTSAIGKYRTPLRVRVMRDGEEDFLSPAVVKGGEINKHDRWETAQKRRSLAHTEQRAQDNLVHTDELRAMGFDPDQESNHEMHAKGDPRRCVLCGEGPIAGDPWQVEHETPVTIGEGRGRKGWAHRSCNQSKGATPVAHASV